MRHLAQEAGAGEPGLRRGSQEHAVEPADVPVFEEFQFQLLELIEAGGIGGGAEDARTLLGVHLGRHRREGEDALDTEVLGEADHLTAEGELADWRLGFAQEDDEVVLPLGIGPDEEAVARPAVRVG